MRRALSSHRFRPLARVNQPCLGAPLTISSATYTRHQWTAPPGSQPCAGPVPTLLRRSQHTQSYETSSTTEISPDKAVVRRLPLQCTGCGAFTQTMDPSQPGYFNLKRKAVQEYLGLIEPKTPRVDEVPEADRVVEEALSKLPPEQLEALGLSKDHLIADRPAAKPEEEGMLAHRSEYGALCRTAANMLYSSRGEAPPGLRAVPGANSPPQGRAYLPPECAFPRGDNPRVTAQIQPCLPPRRRCGFPHVTRPPATQFARGHQPPVTKQAV